MRRRMENRRGHIFIPLLERSDQEKLRVSEYGNSLWGYSFERGSSRTKKRRNQYETVSSIACKNKKNYSCIKSCITTLAEYATGVPGPKMAATPAL